MASYKIYSIVSLLIVIQGFHCIPLEYTEQELRSALLEYTANATHAHQLAMFKLANFESLPHYYVSIVVEATKHLITDEAFMANVKPEVLKFKKNLNQFLQQYDPLANVEAMHETMDIFVTTTDYYFYLPAEESTLESKFIQELLEKYKLTYNAKKVNVFELALNEVRENGRASLKLLIFALDYLLTLPLQYAANATTAAQQLLKDETLMANNGPQVLEFKSKLSTILDVYDPIATDKDTSFQVMDRFANITAHYLAQPEQQFTQETKFIQQLLVKYDCAHVAMSVKQHLVEFLEDFKEMLEEYKEDLEMPLLDWFIKFKKIRDLPKKLKSLKKFFKLLKSSIKSPLKFLIRIALEQIKQKVPMKKY